MIFITKLILVVFISSTFLKQKNYDGSCIPIEVNDYKPLFNNSEWVNTGLQDFEGYKPVKYFEAGDTLIANQIYKMVIKENTWIEGLFASPFHAGLRRDTSYFREDIFARKVWRLDETLQEVLEFDFSLELGAAHPKFADIILNKIDKFVTPEGIERKRFRFEREGRDFFIIWIEGLGSLSPDNSLNASSSMRDDLFEIWGLLCMTQNGSLVYDQGYNDLGLPGSCGNYITVSTREATILDPQLKVFPIPTNDLLYISTDLLVNQEVTISIFDMLGKVHLRYDNMRLSKKQPLSLNGLNSGTYILSIRTDEGTQSLRFVKQ